MSNETMHYNSSNHYGSAILFYELIVRCVDKFLPPTILSLFSNGNPRNLDKKDKVNEIMAQI